MLMLSLFTLIFGLCRNASTNGYSGLYIERLSPGATAELTVNVKGKVTFNSNGQFGIRANLASNAILDINVETDATLETCGNGVDDIYGYVDTSSTATFSGTGYTCDPNKVWFDGDVVKPVCQACPP